MAKFSFILAIIYFLPLLIIDTFYAFVAVILIKSSIRLVGHPFYGYRSKVAFKLLRRSHTSANQWLTDAVAWATQQEREEIMKAIRSDKIYEYVVKEERNLPESEQTVFMCKFIDPASAAALADQLYNVSGVGQQRKERLLTGTQQLTLLKKFLVGWKNMRDENNKEVTFDSNKPLEMIAMIPVKHRRAIADFIQGESELDEGEDQSSEA